MGPVTIQLEPLGKIELLDRYTEAPGPGVEEGTTKRVETNTPFARIDAPFRLSPQWELNFRTEIPVVWTNGVTPENPTGATVSGFGNVLGQAWIVHDFDQRWAVALGGQLIAPTSTNGVATDAWEQVTGFVVRAMLPEISPGSYFAPQVRYGIDFEGNDDGRMLRQLRIAPTLNINLPHNLFFTLYPSPDIRLNYGTPVHEPDGPIVSAAQLHGRLEADRAHSDFGGVRHSDHQGFSRLHFQDSIESGLSVLIPVPSTFAALRRSDPEAGHASGIKNLRYLRSTSRPESRRSGCDRGRSPRRKTTAVDWVSRSGALFFEWWRRGGDLLPRANALPLDKQV